MTADADVYKLVLADLRDQLSEAESAVIAMTAKLDGAKAQRDEVKQEYDALRKSMQRQFPSIKDTPPELLPYTIQSVGISVMPRTYAVEVAVKQLTKSDGFATPEAIEKYVQAEGRSDTRQDIGGALSHLRRTKKIVRLSRGRWAPLDSSLNTAATNSEVEEPE